MNLLTLVLAVLAGRGLGKLLQEDGTLAWRDIDEWVKVVGNPDDHGRGYAGNRLRRARNGHVEISRQRAGASWKVQAELVLNARLAKPADRKVWVVAELDADLERRFAGGYRFTIAL
jgi:hypothetical protein